MLLLLLGRGAFLLGVHWVEMPEEDPAIRRPSVQYWDASGQLVHVERGGDYRWNFPLSYQEIPPDMIRFVLAVEDHRFWEHHGFDWRSGLRAFWQMIRHRRVVSGGSTITMQVMTMRTGRHRTLKYKLRQIFLACQWERSHSKEEILVEYFNQLPYGGKLHGLEAAAQYYFGRHAGELNRNEMILLSGIPQSPRRYSPDRNPQAALKRREMVLHLLVRHGVLTPEEAETVRQEPLRYRQFSTRLWPLLTDTQPLSLVKMAHPGQQEYRLSLDFQLQEQVREALKRQVERLEGVADGAAVVVENATGQVRACVGTLDFWRVGGGAVNGAVSWRSPGSAWKPFLYGEALYGGMLVAETRLLDAPLTLPDYRPENYDGSFRGEVSAREALADSLNTPAVRLLQRLGVERFLRLLWRLDMLKSTPSALAEKVGLSLAIGGTESTLLAMTAAYARLAGAPKGLVWLQEVPAGERDQEELWNEGTRQMVLAMLRRPLPGAGELPVSWKTGTSNGNRDAWCFAVTPQWTVGVWLGNKNGRASSALVGATAAAPVAGSLIQTLSREAPPLWPPCQETLWERRPLCVRSGLTPGPDCGETMPGWTIQGIPLVRCEACGRQEAEAVRQIRILSPAPGEYYREGAGEEEISFSLKTEPSECHLYLNGEYRGRHSSGEALRLGKGSYHLVLWAGEEWTPATLTLQVR